MASNPIWLDAISQFQEARQEWRSSLFFFNQKGYHFGIHSLK